MNNIQLLSPYDISKNIEHIIYQLSKADDTTLKISEISEDLTTGQYDLYELTVDGEWKYYLLAQVVGDSYFIMRVVGGSKLFPWEDFYHAMLPYAKSKDCTHYMFSGSIAWEQKLKDLGFRITEYVYKSRIPN